MDISQMSEEEMLKAALELSMQDVCGARPAAPVVQAPAPTLAALDRSKARTLLQKDAQDALPPCPRSSAQKPRGEPSEAGDAAGTSLNLQDREVADLFRLIFGDRPDLGDLERWLDVGFQFSPRPETAWGFWQRKGGPCGIFAPVQAYLLRSLLFSGEAAEAEAAVGQQGHPMSCSGEQAMRRSLAAHAMTTIIFQAVARSSYVICQVSPAASAGRADEAEFPRNCPTAGSPEAVATAKSTAAIMATGTGGVSVSGRVVRRATDLLQLLDEAVDSWLAGPFGVLSFLCSVLLSRGLEAVREDMDDMTTPLIGAFGHCSQELVNLMLFGEAVSNVFDGTRWLGDDPSSGFLCKGVDSDRVGVPPVGYLSELEAMRYMTVGTLLKHPDCPIWVLGSPTHYTVLFSLRRSDAQLSKTASLEQTAKKVFNDHALDEGSIAMASNLAAMLAAVGVDATRLPQAQKELAREEVILWEEFRAWTARQFGLDGADQAASRKLHLYLYDGQDPPGPCCRAILVEQSDIDPRLVGGGADGDSFTAMLHTRWPNAAVEVSTVDGAGGGVKHTTL